LIIFVTKGCWRCSELVPSIIYIHNFSLWISNLYQKKFSRTQNFWHDLAKTCIYNFLLWTPISIILDSMEIWLRGISIPSKKLFQIIMCKCCDKCFSKVSTSVWLNWAIRLVNTLNVASLLIVQHTYIQDKDKIHNGNHAIKSKSKVALFLLIWLNGFPSISTSWACMILH